MHLVRHSRSDRDAVISYHHSSIPETSTPNPNPKHKRIRHHLHHPCSLTPHRPHVLPACTYHPSSQSAQDHSSNLTVKSNIHVIVILILSFRRSITELPQLSPTTTINHFYQSVHHSHPFSLILNVQRRHFPPQSRTPIHHMSSQSRSLSAPDSRENPSLCRGRDADPLSFFLL